MKIIIVEDEAPAARRLQRLLEKTDYNVEIIEVLRSLKEAKTYFSSPKKGDLLLLDIALGDGDSFQLLEEREIDMPIIFTTAYDDRAIEAFRYMAVDYLLKPIKKESLDKALKKYDQHFKERTNNSSQATLEGQRHLIEIGGKLRVIPYSEVAYYFIYHHMAYLMTFEGKKYPVSMGLEEVMKECCNHQYFRVNRQVILHYKAISKLHKASKSRLEIELAPPLPLEEKVYSSTYRSPDFKKWLKGMK
jgi:DNA-binding LytR/AlgR family response regulator